MLFTKSSEEMEPLQVDRDKYTVTSVICTDAVDHDGEVVLPRGLNFKPIELTRSVLAMHDPYVVVGKMLWIKSDGRQVRAMTKFAVEQSPRAKECFGLVADGYIKGWSIGMEVDSLKMRTATKSELDANPHWEKAQRIIEKADVYEYSVCPFPCNVEAMTVAMGKGLLMLEHTKSLWCSRLDAGGIVPSKGQVPLPASPKFARRVFAFRPAATHGDLRDTVKNSLRSY